MSGNDRVPPGDDVGRNDMASSPASTNQKTRMRRGAMQKQRVLRSQIFATQLDRGLHVSVQHQLVDFRLLLVRVSWRPYDFLGYPAAPATLFLDCLSLSHTIPDFRSCYSRKVTSVTHIASPSWIYQLLLRDILVVRYDVQSHRQERPNFPRLERSGWRGL